ncbi:microviridin/marinostatin family tricyclic proteinase inhibitor, partial [Microcystis aeruginosa]
PEHEMAVTRKYPSDWEEL